MKRIVLFLATNFAIVLVLSLSMRLLGVEPYLTEQGLNLQSLLIFTAVMGFGGSFISLAISKWMAKKSMGVRVVEAPSNSTEFWLIDTIRKYAVNAGVKMPEVGIFDSPQVNAFATGMSKNNSLVAVSSGLLQQMTREEAEAVLGGGDLPCEGWRRGPRASCGIVPPSAILCTVSTLLGCLQTEIVAFGTVRRRQHLT